MNFNLRLLLTIFIFICFVQPTLVFSSAEPNMSVSWTKNSEIQNPISTIANDEKTDIPTWYLQDKWVYNTNITFHDKNISFIGKIKNLTIQIESIERIEYRKQNIPVYKIKITGNVTGKLTPQEPICWPFPINGEMNGYVYTKLSDLSQIKSEINLNAVTQIGGGLSLWFINKTEGEKIGFQMQITSTFNPSLENFDFPIYENDAWATYLRTNISASFSFGGGQYKDSFSTNFSRFQNMTCTNQEKIETNEGLFDSYKISVPEIKGNGLWYVPELKNTAQIKINYSQNNTMFKLESILQSSNLDYPQILIEENIEPQMQYTNKEIVISGKIINTITNQSISNESVVIEIPHVEKKWTVQTNQYGEYIKTIKAPNIVDHTPSFTSEYGSDGIIVWFSSDQEYYNVKTFISKSDTSDPVIRLNKPKQNYLYINNKEICPFFTPLIIGSIDITIDATDYESSIKKVAIYIDDSHQKTLENPPFIFNWNEKTNGIHTICAVAFDEFGNENNIKLTVFKLF